MIEEVKIQEKYKKAIELGFSISKIQMHLINKDKDKVLVLDKEQKIVFFNDALKVLSQQLFSEREIYQLGKKFSVQKLKEVWQKAIQNSFDGEHTRFFDSYVVNEEIVTDIIFISPLTNKNNEITGCVIFGKKISNDKNIPNLNQEPNLNHLYKSSQLAIVSSLGYGMYSCNKEFERLTGYTNEEINSLGISVIFHPEEKDETLEMMLRLHSGEFDSVHMRRRYIRKNGSELWASVSLATIKDENSEVISHIVLAKEISEEQKIEQAFKESEIRFKQLYDHNPLPIIIREVGSISYTRANKAFYQLYGYTEEEFEGLTRKDFWVVDDTEEIKPLIQKLVNKELKSFKQTKQYKKKGGDIFWAEITRSLVSFGDKQYVIGIVKDTDQEKKMELALKESEAQMRTMFMGTADKFIAVDKNYRLIYFNESAAKDLPPLFELEKLEVGVEMLCKKNKRLRKMWLDHFDKGLSGESFELEKKYPIGIKDRTDMVAFSPIKNPKGEIIGVTMIGKEITNLIKTQEALKVSESRLQEAHNLAKLGNWEYNIEKNIFIGSKEILQIFKFPPDFPPIELEEMYKRVHPEDIDELNRQTRDILTSNKEADIQIRILNHEKDWIYIQGTGRPYVKEGKVIKVFGTIQDITKQKEVELNLFKTSEEYRNLFKEMLDAIVITNAKGKVLDANEAGLDLLGYTLEELKSIHLPDIVYEKDRKRSKENLELLKSQGYYKGYEGRVIRKNGELRYIQVNSTATYDEAGNMTGSRDIIRDITELKSIETKREQLFKELEDVNNELKQFAYIVSHDLKAPLRHIKSISSWLQQDYMDTLDEKGKDQLQLLNNRVTRLHAFINGIFEYTKIGRIKKQAELININEIINNISDLLNIQKNVTLDIQPDMPMVLGEKIKIQQVFQNLISNAIKYNDKSHPEIKITYKNLGNHHQFSVTDNGKGINERNFEKIFQIFQTLQPKDNFESTGIGLTIVKRIVKQHGGDIYVKSKLGIGTTFEFTLEK